jgi:hypothetical protein
MPNADGAFQFLDGLEKRLTKRLPSPDVMAKQVSAVWNKPNADKTPREKLACKENIFLYHYVIPQVFIHLLSTNANDEAAARRSIRCEYFKKFPELSNRNAFRRGGHPFPKDIFGVSGSAVMEKWRSPPSNLPIYQAYPDLCLSDPFSFRTVFDAKYFDAESSTAAEDALVSGIYETMFYRGLPPSLNKSGDSDWEYDFGCLLAYDTTRSGYLMEAWNSVTCKPLFWNDARVFVMILRGEVR